MNVEKESVFNLLLIG